jgi:hypothetical protein
MAGAGDENVYVDTWGTYDGWQMWRVWTGNNFVGYVSTKTRDSTEALVLASRAYGDE